MGREKTLLGISVAIIAFYMLLGPSSAPAQQTPSEGEEVAYTLGSVVLSLLHLPFKLVTCVGTQTVTSVAYVATYGVPGNYQGGTNGREIGEVARGACAGPWLISYNQVKEDYQEPVRVERKLAQAKAPAPERTTEAVVIKEVPVEKIVVKEVIKEVPKLVEVERVLFPEVAFRFDSSELTELGKGIVYVTAQRLKAKSDVVAVVEGHADYIGTEDYNQRLGQRRAETVQRELAHLGINPASMSVESFGETKPLVDQRTDWARAVNRRVEIKVKGEK